VKNYTNKARQAGMTLIELTVVLLVLIGLAGLMIPYVGGFVSKTHDSVNSDELAAVNGAIQRYDVQFLGYPSDLDSLIETGSSTVYSKMMRSANFSSYQLKTDELKSLTSVGIKSVYDMNTVATDSATFAATTGSSRTLTTAATTGNVAVMAQIGMGMAFNDMMCSSTFNGKVCDVTNNHYVAFGVGSKNKMIGRTISEAPVHFAKQGDMNAFNKYNRIVAVFEVPKDATANTGKDAKFMGTVMPMMMTMGLGGALDSAYDDMSQ